ncbi:hypothetical protein H696_04424 [Fonticula alba]|uniref:Uncharacterized protein n=1 Tax=Fonticula alba TaxID=691883 RepID=A0A058Z413_FONAL|nr:hypothetical protein H696_04424 [Fonticula alba]KCV69004.1 hypothetical protein H696_04424 [Fonticula alba]|eukprot:XP_009496575.1 hypothetical protein H696_04424 [Fonticula alba]
MRPGMQSAHALLSRRAPVRALSTGGRALFSSASAGNPDDAAETSQPVVSAPEPKPALSTPPERWRFSMPAAHRRISRLARGFPVKKQDDDRFTQSMRGIPLSKKLPGHGPYGETLSKHIPASSPEMWGTSGAHLVPGAAGTSASLLRAVEGHSRTIAASLCHPAARMDPSPAGPAARRVREVKNALMLLDTAKRSHNPQTLNFVRNVASISVLINPALGPGVSNSRMQPSEVLNFQRRELGHLLEQTLASLNVTASPGAALMGSSMPDLETGTLIQSGMSPDNPRGMEAALGPARLVSMMSPNQPSESVRAPSGAEHTRLLKSKRITQNKQISARRRSNLATEALIAWTDGWDLRQADQSADPKERRKASHERSSRQRLFDETYSLERPNFVTSQLASETTEATPTALIAPIPQLDD